MAMTLVAPERRTQPVCEPALRNIPSERRTMLARQIARAAAPGLGNNVGFNLVVADAISAFIDSEGSCSVAIQKIEGRTYELGARLADAEVSLAQIATSFEHVLLASQQGLQMALGTTVTGYAVIRLRESIPTYVQRIQLQVSRGWQQRQQQRATPAAERREHARLGVFRGGSRLEHLLELAGFDPTTEFTAVVSVHSPLPSVLLESQHVLAGNDPREALIPTGWAETLGDQIADQVVVGSPAGLARVADSLDLVRRGATLLRESATTDDRTIVPCNDLLSLLILKGNRLLADLLVEKHLAPLSDLSRDRRNHLAELLLEWLERGLPLSQLANSLGIPPQTAHSRMQAIRKIFGGSLDDPAARLEIILALRTALPEWLAEENH